MRVYWLFLIISIPIVIISSNLLFLTFNKNFYFSIYNQTAVYTQIDKNLANSTTNELLGYFRGKNNLEHKYFSEQAIYHLKDVKNLFNYAQILTVFAFGTLLVSVAVLISKKQYQIIQKGLKLATLTTLILCSLSIIISVISFQQSFILFHKIVFSNNLWLFDQSDNLIRLFPIDFFIIFTKKLLINIIATTTLILGISFVRIKK